MSAGGSASFSVVSVTGSKQNNNNNMDLRIKLLRILRLCQNSKTSKNGEKWKLPYKYVFIMNISNFNLQIEACFFQSCIAKDWIFIYSCGIWSFEHFFWNGKNSSEYYYAIFFFLLVGQEDWKLCYSGRRETFYETFSSSRWT